MRDEQKSVSLVSTNHQLMGQLFNWNCSELWLLRYEEEKEGRRGNVSYPSLPRCPKKPTQILSLLYLSRLNLRVFHWWRQQLLCQDFYPVNQRGLFLFFLLLFRSILFFSLSFRSLFVRVRYENLFSLLSRSSFVIAIIWGKPLTFLLISSWWISNQSSSEA